jgi:hypothetical protein
MGRHLKTSMLALAHDFIDSDKRLARRLQSAESGLTGKTLGALHLTTAALRVLGGLSLFGVLRRNLKVGEHFKGKGLGKVGHIALATLKLLFGVRSTQVIKSHLAIQGFLQVVILPFEDKYCIDSERLERCPAGFAYHDVETGIVRFVPTCAWPLYKNGVLRKITDHYAKADGAKEPVAAASSASGR